MMFSFFEHKPKLRVTVEHRPAGYQGIDDETPIRRADIRALIKMVLLIAAGLFVCGLLSGLTLFLMSGNDPGPDAAALVLSGTSPIVSTYESGVTVSPSGSPTPSDTPTLTMTHTATPPPTFTALPTNTPTPTVDLTQVYLDVYGPLAQATYERLIQTAVDATVFARTTPAPINAQRTAVVIEIKGLTETR